ncbi:hypothetical protein GCM10019997_15470 [Prevotella corporis]
MNPLNAKNTKKVVIATNMLYFRLVSVALGAAQIQAQISKMATSTRYGIGNIIFAFYQ